MQVKLVDKEFENAFYNAGLQALENGNVYKFSEIKSLSDTNGIYALYKGSEPIYIGSAKDIRNRWVHHKNKNGSALLEKIQDYSNISIDEYLKDCYIKHVSLSIGRSELEDYLIKYYNPVFNYYKAKKRKGIL